MQALAEFFRTGGPVMYINAFTSVLVLAVIVERVINLFFRNQINSQVLLEQIRKLVGANNITRAVKLCSASSAPAARVAKAGLTHLNKGEIAVATAIEESLVDVTPEIKTRISALWSLANIATLLGLVGTIFGLIKTFGSIGSANPADRQRLLSDGISEAMNNTALGLAIAVTCMIGHLVLSGRSKVIQSELDAFSLKLENCLVEWSKKEIPPTAGEAER